MKIRLDRKTLANSINYKTAIEFPSDSKIWLGELSLFKFDVSFNELNQIISENNNLKTLYEVGTDCRIDVKSKISEHKDESPNELLHYASQYAILIFKHIASMINE